MIFNLTYWLIRSSSTSSCFQDTYIPGEEILRIPIEEIVLTKLSRVWYRWRVHLLIQILRRSSTWIPYQSWRLLLLKERLECRLCLDCFQEDFFFWFSCSEDHIFRQSIASEHSDTKIIITLTFRKFPTSEQYWVNQILNTCSRSFQIRSYELFENRVLRS